MQSKTTFKRIGGFLHKSLMVLGLFCLFTGKINAQTYVNGNLSTGATSSDGTAAPAGYTWSEVQLGNVNAGFSASIVNNFTLADDFTVPAGTWGVTKITFYAYSTGFAGTTSPFNDVRVQIYNTNPSIGSPVPVFGDLTTNRFLSSSSANMYRMFNGTPGTTREIWQVEATVSTPLTAGTYWIEYQIGTSLTSNFCPSSTVVGSATQPGNNALRRTLPNTWAALVDGTNAQDLPFKIDYTTSACTGTPAPGQTLSTATTVCPGIPFTLSLTNGTSGSGVTYQWQSSPDNVTYTNIAGATNTTLSTSHGADTYYQCVVTCSGNNGISTPVLVALTPATGCYCTSTSTSSADEDIFNVTIGTLNNTSNCTTLAPGFGSVLNRYSNYTSGTGIPAPGEVISGGTNPVSIQVGTCGGAFTNRTAMWIDFDHSGSFDANEKVYTTPVGVPAGPHIETGNAFIPATALNGITRMRVVTVETGTVGNIQPCGTYTWGETEDYLVNISPCTPVAITTQPVNATTVCAGNASFSVAASGNNPSFQWEQRVNASSAWTFVQDNSMFSGATTGTLSITTATLNMNGYQYRAVFTGSCTATDFSNIATLNVTPLTATVTPTSANICNGSSQQFSITNLDAASTTATFTSGALTSLIPDNDDNGIVTGPINISGIPAGAIITDVSVKLNISHTWVGDLDINLIAPNTGNLNLVGSLNGGTGGNGTDDFTNTVISSSSTNPISGAAAPRTGIFAAEARAGYGPTPNPQTVTSWAGLTSLMNGDWSLAIADFAGGDEGTLTSWSISVTYSAPILATGVFTPYEGLYNDAALTSPYTGAAVNTVYCGATTSTNYTLVVTTAVCTSAPLVIPVTVSNPVGTLTQPVNSTICANNNTSFTVTAASGNDIAYQWQESADGTNYTNITNGGVYGGATTNTLTLTNVPTTYNGYKYRAVLSVSACSSSATSDAATLNVNTPPSVAISAAPYTRLYPGLTTAITATLTPASAATYQWYLNGNAISGANAATYIANIDGLGEYTVDVVAANSCPASSTSSITIADSLTNTLFIYPNPNTGVFQVRYNDRNNDVNNKPRILTVYDSKGARVYSKTFSVNAPFGRMDVDLRKQPKGVYAIDLTDASGNRLQTERVIVF